MNAEPDAAAQLRIEVHRGEPTPEELAAALAVVSAAYADETASAVAEDHPRPSAWQISARGLREPLNRDLGWR